MSQCYDRITGQGEVHDKDRDSQVMVNNLLLIIRAIDKYFRREMTGPYFPYL